MFIAELNDETRAEVKAQYNAMQKRYPDRRILLLSEQERSCLYHGLCMQKHHIDEIWRLDKGDDEMFRQDTMYDDWMLCLQQDTLALGTEKGTVFLLAVDKTYPYMLEAFLDGACNLVDCYSKQYLKEGVLDELFKKVPTT